MDIKKISSIFLIFILFITTAGCNSPKSPPPVSSGLSGPSAPMPQEVSSSTPPIDRGQRESFESLKNKNPHFIGWMTIPETMTHDPVVLYEDNDYYLYRSFSGKKNKDGTLFADKRTKLTADDMSQNITVYGHNMASGRMFGQVLKYKKLEFYKKSPVIVFDTIFGNNEWKIFAMFITNTLKKHGEIFDYRQPEYESPEAFLGFIEQVRRRSLINCPVDVMEDDRIITLSTCSYELEDARFVVMARRVRDGEDSYVDVEKAERNPKILYPKGWYSKYGGKMPEF